MTVDDLRKMLEGLPGDALAVVQLKGRRAGELVERELSDEIQLRGSGDPIAWRAIFAVSPGIRRRARAGRQGPPAQP